MGDGAIRKDVQEGNDAALAAKPADGVVDPNEVQQPKGIPYDPRAAAMEGVLASRRAALRAEGIDVPEPEKQIATQTDEDDDGADAAAEAARNALEAKPAGKAEKVEDQLAKQDANEELIFTPEQLAKAKVRIKVDGEERVLDGTKVLASIQKDEAADVRLARASAAEKEAQTKLAEANKKLAEADTVREKKAAEKAVAEASAELESVGKEFAEALYGGDSEKAVKLFAKAVTSAVDSRMQGRGDTAISIDPSRIAQEVAPAVQQQIELSSALRQLDKDYPEIRQDEGFARIADRERSRLMNEEGLSLPDAILKAGEVVAQKYRFGKYASDAAPAKKDEGRPNGPSVSVTAARDSAKSGIDDPVSTSSRASSELPAPATASDTIRKIAAARGQQIG